MRTIFGPKREEVVEDWRRLRNAELHNLYASPNVIRMINSRSMRWVRYVACMEMRKEYTFLVGKPDERDLSGNFGKMGG